MVVQRKLVFLATIMLNFAIMISLENNEMRTCTDGALRLAGGPNEFEGRVEICFGGEWGLVCGRDWEDLYSHSTITCRHLGYIPGGITRLHGWPRDGNEYGSERRPAFLNVNPLCGNPRIIPSLLNCSNYDIINITSGCPDGTTPAAVVCPDTRCTPNKVQVVNETDGGQHLEICLDLGTTPGSNQTVRAGICSQNWNNSDAKVVCKNGLDTAQAINGPISNIYSFILNTSIDCSGNEANFSDCLTYSSDSILFNDENGCVLAGVQCHSQVNISESGQSFSKFHSTSVVIATSVSVEPTYTIASYKTSIIKPGSSPQTLTTKYSSATFIMTVSASESIAPTSTAPQSYMTSIKKPESSPETTATKYSSSHFSTAALTIESMAPTSTAPRSFTTSITRPETSPKTIAPKYSSSHLSTAITLTSTAQQSYRTSIIKSGSRSETIAPKYSSTQFIRATSTITTSLTSIVPSMMTTLDHGTSTSTSDSKAAMYALIAIGSGIGALVILVLVMVVLIVLISIATKKYSGKKHHSEANNTKNDRPVSAEYDDSTPVVKATHSPTPEKSNDSVYDDDDDNEPEKVVINPLYTKPFVSSSGYAKMLVRDSPTQYAILTPQRLSTCSSNTNGVAVGSRGGPDTDAQGYVELEAPLRTSKPLPYETPQLLPSSMSKQNNFESVKSPTHVVHIYDTVKDK